MSLPPPAYQAPKVTQLELFPSLAGQRVILCSASPRRLALLQQIGLAVEVIPSEFPELLDKSQYDVTPWAYATATATEKVLAVYRRTSEDTQEPRLLIGSDTIILAGGHKILETPTSPAQHLEMLKLLRGGGPHKVFTAVVALCPNDDMPIAPGYIMRTHIEETTVTFDEKISDDVLAAYVQSGEGRDKAGGYAVQGQGAVLIKRIEGSYDAVVGLPLNATYRLIQEVLDWDPYQVDEAEQESE